MKMDFLPLYARAAQWWVRLLVPAMVAASLLGHALTAHAGPYGANQCAASRFGSDLVCSANDVSLNSITVAGTPPASCVGGSTLPLNLNVTINFGSSTRYDIGVFLSNNGLNPWQTTADSCSVGVLPTSSPFWGSVASGGDGDACGDGGSNLSGTFTMTGVTVPCTTDGSGAFSLYIPYAISWDQQSTNYCGDNTYPVPGTTSKCNKGTVSFPPGTTIVVLPTITITDGVISLLSTGSTTYTIVITNNTGSPVSGAVFQDPLPANFSYSSVSCTAGGGATCPAVNTTNIQSGVTLPSMPNSSSLTFTVTGSLDGNLCGTLTNTASVSLSGQTNPASDSNTVICPPTVSKSFSPSAIVSGGTSTLTVTLTNPNATTAIAGAAFTDNYPSTNLKNASPANLSNTCGGTATGTAGSSSLSLSGGVIPASSSCAVSVDVTSAVAGSYLNSTGSVTTTNAGTGTAATATLTVTSSAPGSFNAFETSTAANAISGVIKTKVAGSAFNLDVVAITGGAQAGSFSDTVKVELLGNTTTGIALDANNCPTSFTLLQTVSPATISGGRSTVNFTAVSDAWKDVRVRISYPTSSPTITSCSTDNFAIRPNALGAYAAHNDWETVGTSLTLNNSGTSGGEIHKAGRNFTLVATGYNAASVVTGNYDGSPTAVSAAAVAPATVTGSFSVGTFSAGAGTVRSDTATYDEVGAVSLILQDQTFASVDASDTTGDCTATGRYVCSATFNVGRFVPDHFIVTPGTLTNRRLLACSPASSFTYAGEQLRVAFTLTARNGAATPAVTQNYTTASGLAKLDGTVIANFGLGAIDLADLTPPTGATALTGSLGLVASSGSWVAGVGSFTADLGLNRSATPDGPYESFRLGILPTDTDSVTVRASDLNLDTTEPPDTNDRVLAGSSIVRFGRLRLSNAHGSELLDLPIPIYVQYWNGTQFVTNAEDSCTSLSSSNIGLNNYKNNLASGETSVSPATINFTSGVASGVNTLKLTAPGVGNSGSVDVCVDLGSDPVGGTTCSATASASLSYLQGKWAPGAAWDNDPKVRATFGVYKNANEFIYLREMY